MSFSFRALLTGKSSACKIAVINEGVPPSPSAAQSENIETSQQKLLNAASIGDFAVVDFQTSDARRFISLSRCTDADGNSPLHLSAREGHLPIVQLLLSRGAHVDILTTNSSTPLHLASENGKHQVVECLLSHGADKEATNHGGWRSLHIAAVWDHYFVADCLINTGGADVNAAIAANGRTPLILAAYSGHSATVHCLVNAGADKNRGDSHGRTALW